MGGEHRGAAIFAPGLRSAFDHDDRYVVFARDASGWLRDGSLKYRETIVEGIEHAPDAFVGLLEGENIGKMLVKL